MTANSEGDLARGVRTIAMRKDHPGAAHAQPGMITEEADRLSAAVPPTLGDGQPIRIRHKAVSEAPEQRTARDARIRLTHTLQKT